MKLFKSMTVGIILIGISVALYIYFDSRDTSGSNSNGDDAAASDLMKIVNMDLENQYPLTPREIVDLYARIQTCFYNETYTEEDFEKLVEKARLLLDEDLLGINTYEEYCIRLQEEISQYKNKKRRISQYEVTKNKEVEYYTYEKRNYATLYCIYYLRTPKESEKSPTRYTLRKDKNGLWKIYGYQLVAMEDIRAKE